MRRILSLAIALTLFQPLARARTLENVQKSGTLIVATNGTFAPFSYYEKLKLSGFEIDLIEALASELKVKVEWKIIPFDNTLIGLNQNRYDLVIASHGITDERAKIVEFTKPYYCSSAVIMSRQGGPRARTELRGKALGAQVGTTYINYLKAIEGHGEIKTFKSETDTLMALSGGRVEAMIGDRVAALVLLKSRPELKLQIGETLLVEHIAMAIQKGNTSLVEAINKSLQTLQKNGTYTKISTKYFGEDIRCK
ncbi:MAG TPA: ABC transporter substrate-binding protein [Bdellovibrionota bacterium]|jgi:polar amino acid transport system substrate-binding protein|nr:ABC transporter substrate-binding protein [Bdellovibrionota bacterium]